LAGRPSGAKVRIVNTYVPLTGDPVALDIYAAPWVSEGARPLLSVPFGTASDFFDPTVSDDAGDMFLSAYVAGETGNGNAVADQTETLKGGEIITMLVATGSNPKPNGGRYGGIQVYFHAAKGGTFGQQTPEPGKGVLFVSTLGLENILANPEANDLYLKLSGDSGCTNPVDANGNTLAGVGPGQSTPLVVAPGTYTAAIYSVPSSSSVLPSCTGTPLLKDIAVTIAADQTTMLVIYGAKETDLRTLVLPFDK